MKKYMFVLCVIVFILSIVTVAAENNFSLSYTPVDDSVQAGEAGVYILNITGGKKIGYFQVYTLDPLWVTGVDPTFIEVYPYATSEITLKLTPSYKIDSGSMLVPIYVKDYRNNEFKKLNIRIDVLPGGEQEIHYKPSVRITLVMSEQIDPREDIPIKIEIKNQNPLNLSNIDVIINSKLFSKTHSISLDALEKKTLDFTASLSEKQEPLSDALTVTAIVHSEGADYTFEADAVEYDVINYGELSETVEESKGFLSYTKVVTFTNTGNKDVTINHVENAGSFNGKFADSEPSADIRTDDNTTYFIWDIDVPAFESRTVAINTNYRPLFYVLVVVALALLIYFRLRSSLIMKKSARRLDTGSEISEMIVQINVQNRSRKKVNNVVVTDLLPNLIEVEKEFRVGTIHPTKILKHEKKGTIIKWELSGLEKGEERILTYRVKSKLSILGSVTLPQAAVKFIANGKEGVSASNSLKIVSPEDNTPPEM